MSISKTRQKLVTVLPVFNCIFTSCWGFLVNRSITMPFTTLSHLVAAESFAAGCCVADAVIHISSKLIDKIPHFINKKILIALLHEYKIHRKDKACECREMVPVERLVVKEHYGEHCEYNQRYNLLNHFQLD